MTYLLGSSATTWNNCVFLILWYFAQLNYVVVLLPRSIQTDIQKRRDLGHRYVIVICDWIRMC